MTGESVVTRSMTYFAQFVRGIAFGENRRKPAALQVSHGDGWAMESEGMTFGWTANPGGGVAKETITIPGLEGGDYGVYFYRTWRGQYLDPLAGSSPAGALTVTVPELKGGACTRSRRETMWHSKS